jgi:hypothetical protein
MSRDRTAKKSGLVAFRDQQTAGRHMDQGEVGGKEVVLLFTILAELEDGEDHIIIRTEGEHSAVQMDVKIPKNEFI